jgi:hypothetical protein
MVGTQHIVAALNADPESRSARVLARLGFVLVRREGKPTFGVDVKPDEAAPLLSPQAVTAIAGALQRTGLSTPSGSIELCLGILDQGAGIGAQILGSAGVNVAAIEKTLRLVPRDQSDPAGCTIASWPMWQIRASARMGAGRWVEARDDFLVAERAVSTEEQRALCRNNAAWASLMSGDATLRVPALELSRAALAVQPRPSRVHRHVRIRAARKRLAIRGRRIARAGGSEASEASRPGQRPLFAGHLPGSPSAAGCRSKEFAGSPRSRSQMRADRARGGGARRGFGDSVR